MYAVYQVCFDVPYAEEFVEWAQGLPWPVWATLGWALYLIGFRAAGRVVAGLASTPGGRVASALAWPVTLALFPVCKAVSAVGRLVLAPLVRRLDAAVAPTGATVPLAQPTSRTGGFVVYDLENPRTPPKGGSGTAPPREP